MMLLKKIDRSQAFIQGHLDLFLCPVCHLSLNQLTGYQLTCSHGHQFELNKKGVLHFLNHKIKTDYNREMLLERQKMIQAGLYQPLIDYLANKIEETCPELVIDLGCGEGSFLQQLTQAGVPGTKIGFDISKDGVALATEQDIEAFWCVADITNLPFTNQSASHLLNIFSPSHYQEFRRVLKSDGRVIKVVPEANYLKELRALFYEDDETKQSYSNELVVEKFTEEMTLLSCEQLTYEFPVPLELQEALFKMSPLQWGASTENLLKATEKQVDKITIDVKILVGVL